jgi:hypothetical protein
MRSVKSNASVRRVFTRRRQLAIGVVVASLCAGCGNTMRSGLATVKEAFASADEVLPAAGTLDLRFAYLRVHVEGRVALMASADHDFGPQGRTAIWYSADGVVLRLADGRLVGMTDGARSWHWVSAAAPIDWQAVRTQGRVIFEQVIDQQPGWRFGQRRTRVVEALAGPPASHGSVDLPAPVQWFEERNAAGPAQPSWYAVTFAQKGAEVVYGQTCLDTRWCLSWQPWPVASDPAAQRAGASAPGP